MSTFSKAIKYEYLIIAMFALCLIVINLFLRDGKKIIETVKIKYNIRAIPFLLGCFNLYKSYLYSQQWE